MNDRLLTFLKACDRNHYFDLAGQALSLAIARLTPPNVSIPKTITKAHPKGMTALQKIEGGYDLTRADLRALAELEQDLENPNDGTSASSPEKEVLRAVIASISGSLPREIQARLARSIGDSGDESSSIIPRKGLSPSEGTPTTLIEHDLGPLAGFAAEVLDFLQATASAQDLNGGPVSHKLLADQLLYKLQPALFKFKLSEKAAVDVRNRLLDTLAAADYLRATYRKSPGGGETGATCYEITPKYLEAQEDALKNGSPALKAKLGQQAGNLAGVTFTEAPPESQAEAHQVTPGALEKAFAEAFLPGLASARVTLLSGKFDDAAAKAELVWARFLARALGRNIEDMVDFDVDSLVYTLSAFPEWPFDPEESKILWDTFKPGAWNGLDETALNQKINELTSFHEAYQLRGAGIQK